MKTLLRTTALRTPEPAVDAMLSEHHSVSRFQVTNDLKSTSIALLGRSTYYNVETEGGPWQLRGTAGHLLPLENAN